MLTRHASTASRQSAVCKPLFQMQLLRLMSCTQVEHEPSVPTLEALLLSCITFAAQHNLAAVMACSSTLHRNHTLLLHAAAAAVAVVLELLVSQQRQPSLWMQAQLWRTRFLVVVAGKGVCCHYMHSLICACGWCAAGAAAVAAAARYVVALCCRSVPLQAAGVCLEWCSA